MPSVLILRGISYDDGILRDIQVDHQGRIILKLETPSVLDEVPQPRPAKRRPLPAFSRFSFPQKYS
ncbi:hypothetical protein LCGC14_1104840 [marine sediment metagenome]|uniref:Uncharacterized protein n=1 Tax=marine sediment metagenome TaxID=412755 RepID=A0A0F9M8G1_9ZZZZ